MRISTIARAVIVALFSMSSLQSFACGESLFRVGKGVNYRNYVAPLPANIVVVARTETELAMVERLAAAGHQVTVVSNPEAISDSLAAGDYDIVLALFSQREIVESQLAGFPVTYLPVALEDTDEIRLARQLYAHSLDTDDGVKKYLQTIHKTLKQSQA